MSNIDGMINVKIVINIFFAFIPIRLVFFSYFCNKVKTQTK